ncbi:hypothetical protein K490DRAFT_55758 [Saccharata proteae CBS 121410]|uniref:Uncharacterized protein n=1 Tax=Saccharata proteae CBS 121410 TaxID=1314787 RepID=A0A6A5YBB9_9PEZI|nr:hypothetical protein K490DRAFT_55758 [Saccharata proteae CBS 121410]
MQGSLHRPILYICVAYNEMLKHPSRVPPSVAGPATDRGRSTMQNNDLACHECIMPKINNLPVSKTPITGRYKSQRDRLPSCCLESWMLRTQQTALRSMASYGGQISRAGHDSGNAGGRSWSMQNGARLAMRRQTVDVLTSRPIQDRTSQATGLRTTQSATSGTTGTTGALDPASYRNQRQVDDLRFIGSWPLRDSGPGHPAATTVHSDRTVRDDSRYGSRTQAQDPLQRWMAEDAKTSHWNSEAATASYKQRQG